MALQNPPPDAVATGTLGALNATLTLATDGDSQVAIYITGTFVGTVAVQRTYDGINWLTVNIVPVGGGGFVTAFTAPGGGVGNPAAALQVRAIMTAYTSGTASVTLRGTAAAGGVYPLTTFPTRTGGDASRVGVVLHASAIASVTTEALLSLTGFKAGAAIAPAASYTVTTGKTLRVQSLRFRTNIAAMSTTVTFANISLRLRATTGAAMSTTAPLVLQTRLDAAANAPGPDVEIPLPDGLEFPAGAVIGISQLGSAATLVSDVTIIGFEYTP